MTFGFILTNKSFDIIVWHVHNKEIVGYSG